MPEQVSVTEAVMRRKSVRAFLDEPVATDMIRQLLEKSARSPSGGNVQPWHVAIVNGEPMERFKVIMERRLSGEARQGGDGPEYAVYPPKLKEPYRTYRFAVGEEMYRLLGIKREDRPARLRWFANNYRFFGAPAAIFCFTDRVMGAPQWADLGMFLQTFMLLAEEAGLATCPQECWSNYAGTVSDFCDAPHELMLFCGVAIGSADPDAPVNRLNSKRAPLEDWMKIVR